MSDAGALMESNQGSKSPEKSFLTTKEAAAWLSLVPNTLEKMRVYGGGPPFRKHGRHVRYHLDDLVAWSTASRRKTTSDVR